MIVHLINAIQHFIGALGYPGITLLMTLAAACIPIPSEAIMSFSGSLVVTDPGHFRFGYIAVAGALGDLMGASIAYWAGAIGGRAFVVKYGRYVLIRASDVARAERHYQRFGEGTVLLLRIVPLVRAFSSVPAGLARMNFAKFCVFTLIGGSIWCTLLTYLGVQLGNHWEQVSTWLHKADVGVLIVLVICFGFWLRHHLKPEAHEPAASEPVLAPGTNTPD